MTQLVTTLDQEEPKIIDFSSGLKAAVWPVRGYQKKYGFLSCPFGSTNNRLKIGEKVFKIPEGTAHFLEHKVFAEKGGGNVFDRFAALGASCNAYTTYNSTNYIFSTWGHTEACLSLLLKFVQSLYITDASLDKEKKVIQQEISMYMDHPGWRAVFNLLNAMYHRHPVALDIAGTHASVSEITRENIEFCHRTFYHPTNLILVIIGDLDYSKICKQIEFDQNKIKKEPAPQYALIPPREQREIKTEEICEKGSVSQPVFHMGIKVTTHPQAGHDLLKRDIAFSLFLDILLGSGSIGFYELYDEGLVDDGFSTGFAGDSTFGHVLIGGRTDYPYKLQERLLNLLRKTKLKGIKEEDLKRAKRKLWGTFISGLNSLEILAGQYVKDYRRGLHLSDHFRILEAVELKDLEDLFYNNFREEQICYSIIEPYGD